MKESKSVNKVLKILSWPAKVLVITFCLSFLFSSISEEIMEGAPLAVCFIIAIVFIAIAILFDMIALATTSCKIEPFLAMASRHEKGAKQSILLLKNSGKISTICADIVGDICGIISGTVSAKIVFHFKDLIISTFTQNPLFAALVSSIIAALTVSIKSLSKHFSITYCNEIITGVGKFLYIFSFNKSNKKKPKKAKNKKFN